MDAKGWIVYTVKEGEGGIPIETRTTCSRLPVSIYCPTAGANTIVERLRTSAYKDMGTKVPGKIAAR